MSQVMGRKERESALCSSTLGGAHLLQPRCALPCAESECRPVPSSVHLFCLDSDRTRLPPHPFELGGYHIVIRI
jgi:hypothetical protein